jgi:hypothetical protein
LTHGSIKMGIRYLSQKSFGFQIALRVSVPPWFIILRFC